MSGNKINLNERSKEENKVLEGDTLFIPRTVREEGKAVEANYRDDIEETARELDEVTGLNTLETYENEENYQSPEDDEVVDLERFEELKRIKAQQVGHRVWNVFSKVA